MFGLFTFVLLSTLIFCHSSDDSCQKETCSGADGLDVKYKAAVVEFQPAARSQQMSALEHMKVNLQQYSEFVAKAASQSADIIVFPEYGLTTTAVYSADVAEKYGQRIPSSEKTVQELSDKEIIIRQLMDMASQNRIYMVVNLVLEEAEMDSVEGKETWKLYNANVAFDRTGNIVTRYRKFNLYGEENVFSAPPVPDVSYFDADFGIRIGTMICFDIAFDEPSRQLFSANVNAIAYPTAWVDEVPLLTAIQYHTGWAQSRDIPVLSAGYHDPSHKQLGSGIFNGQQGILDYVFNPEVNGSEMVIAEIHKESKVNKEAFEVPPLDQSNHLLLTQDLSHFQFKHLDKGSLSQHLTLELDSKSGSRCTLEYSRLAPNPEDSGSYSFIGYRGKRTVGKGVYSIGIETCALVFCEPGTVGLEKCGKRPPKEVPTNLTAFSRVKLTHHHSQDLLLSSPVSLDTNLQPVSPLKLAFSKVSTLKSTLELVDQVSDLYSLGLFGRLYHLDGPR